MFIKSLGAQLSWRVGGIQLLTFAASLSIMIATTWSPPVYTIPTQLAKDVAKAVHVQERSLSLTQAALPATFSARPNEAWFVARGPLGQELRVGHVPDELAALAGRIDNLEETQLRSNTSRLAATVFVDRRREGDVRVFVGGVPEQGIAENLMLVGKFVFLPMFLPVVIASCLIIPWVIRRRLRGIRRVADQAEVMDFEHKGAALEFKQLPKEVQPLVRSFNTALARISETFAARDRFLADAAHELRMPMAILRARLSSLPHNKDKLRLVSDLTRLETIAEQLLDLQRLVNSNEAYRSIDLVELCESLAAEVAPMIVEHGYDFSFDAPAQAVRIIGDIGSLERMFKNLLHNAVLHGGQRGSIVFKVLSSGRVQVSDSGPGIPIEERQRIFSPFYRLNKSVNGSGLGLHLANEVVTKHGGRIRVIDSIEGGASFEVILPLAGQLEDPGSRQRTPS